MGDIIPFRQRRPNDARLNREDIGDKDGEVIQLNAAPIPEDDSKIKTNNEVRRIYGAIILQPWACVAEPDELMARLIDKATDGILGRTLVCHLSESDFIEVCDEFSIGSDTMGDMYQALKKNSIFDFIEDSGDLLDEPEEDEEHEFPILKRLFDAASTVREWQKNVEKKVWRGLWIVSAAVAIWLFEKKVE